MLARRAGQPPDLGCHAVSTARALKAEPKCARKKWPGGVWDKIWTKLKTARPPLWSMISHLLTVKEWTVSGQPGSGVFGLPEAVTRR